MNQEKNTFRRPNSTRNENPCRQYILGSQERYHGDRDKTRTLRHDNDGLGGRDCERVEGACGMDCCRVLKVKTPSSGYKFFGFASTLSLSRVSERERDLAFNPWKVKDPEEREKGGGGERDRWGYHSAAS